MAEEKVKEASVLNSGEIDFVAGLIAKGEEGEQDMVLLNRQKDLLVEKRFREIWYAWQNKRWEVTLDTIKEIPEDVNLNSLMMANFPGKPYVGSIGRASVMMLFKNATKHLTIEQVKSVDRFLKRIGSGINREPWKTMFLEMARKYFPKYIKKMVEALSETGVYEQEYLNAVWAHEMEVLANDEDLTVELIMNKTFVQLVTYIDEKMNNGSQVHGKKLLEVSDAFLTRDKVYDACQVYKALKKEQNLLIGETREKIICISDMYQEGNVFFHFSQERMVKQVKRVIKKSGQELYIIIK